MKEIRLWKIALIWFGVPVILGMIFGICSYIINLEGITDTIIMFTAFLGLLISVLIAGRVRMNLIKERYADFKIKLNKKEILSVVATQILLSIGLGDISFAVLANKDINNALNLLNDTTGNPTNNFELILWFVILVLLAPILEELVFRRVVFTRLSRKFSFILSAMISSILFGIGHYDLGILGAIAFGITCCIMYKKYNNILVPIMIHIINNFIAASLGAISYFDGTMNVQTTSISQLEIRLSMMSGIIFTFISVVIFINFIKKNKKYIEGGVS